MGNNIWQPANQPQQALQITRNGGFKDVEPTVKQEITEDPVVPADFALSKTGNGYQDINMDTPLPKFSTRILNYINDNDVSAVWGAFVEECAQHYYNICPNIQNSSEYQMIGKKMYATYPTIACEGKEPWSFFCKTLSQKIRHIKWKNKKKLGLSRKIVKRGSRLLPAVKLRSVSRRLVRKYIPSKEHKVLVEELTEGYENKTISDERIKEILKETFKSRCSWITNCSSGQLSPMFDSFPCFSEGKFIVYEFVTQVKKLDEVEVLQKFKDIVVATGKMLTPEITDIGDMEAITILKYMEENTSFSKSKLGSSIITHKEICSEEEMNLYLQTTEKTPPHIIVFGDSCKVERAFIVGDEKVITMEETSVFYALLVLIATYHTFNLQYPKVFSQVLGLFQTYGVGVPFSGSKSNKCTLFIKKLLQNFPPL